MNTGYNFLAFKDPRLDRFVPTDFDHVSKYPLRLDAVTKPSPVTVGVNWYSNFDNPVQDANGLWWVGKGNLGSIRGGHCVCMPHDYKKDLKAWITWYNQVNEGKCVGEGSSRTMTLLNRKMYDPTWLWNEAKKVDEFPDTNPGDDNGTTVRAAMDVLRTLGHVRKRTTKPNLADGILANRWATNIDDLFSVMQNDKYKKLAAIPFINSWGEDYPHITWMPCETWDRLMKEQGEFAIITDR
jgi:hypothetical protein